MINQPSPLAIQAAKDHMNKAIKASALLDDNADLNVSCCVYAKQNPKKEGGYIFTNMRSQICHAEVPDKARGCDFVLDHIQTASTPTKKERVAFLQYVMDHPIFKDSFWEHDAEKAVEEKIMVRRVDKLPSNVMMFAFIFTRAMWEKYQAKIPGRFVDFLSLGLEPDRAMIAAHFFKVNKDGSISYSPNASSGHTAFSSYYLQGEYIKNYLKHKVVSVTTKTVYEGGQTSGPDLHGYTACVDNVFEKTKIRDGSWGVDRQLGKGKPMVQATSLGELLEWFDDLMKEKE